MFLKSAFFVGCINVTDAAHHKGLIDVKELKMQMLKDFHMDIRNASKHELVELIEYYDRAIKRTNKKNGFNIPTLENLWDKLQEEKINIKKP